LCNPVIKILFSDGLIVDIDIFFLWVWKYDIGHCTFIEVRLIDGFYFFGVITPLIFKIAEGVGLAAWDWVMLGSVGVGPFCSAMGEWVKIPHLP
jgi:hypothetical protein